MIITLTGATFSTSIGTLDSWFIQTSITGGGLTASESNIKSIRKDDTAGATLTYTYDTENYKYTNGTVTDATGATVGSINGSNGTVTVTLNAGNTIKGKITIAILMEYIGSGGGGSEGGDEPTDPTPDGTNIFATATLMDGYACEFSSAKTYANESFYTYQNIPVEAGKVYAIPGMRNAYVTDANGTFISGVSGLVNHQYKDCPSSIIIPSNGAYLTYCAKYENIAAEDVVGLESVANDGDVLTANHAFFYKGKMNGYNFTETEAIKITYYFAVINYPVTAGVTYNIPYARIGGFYDSTNTVVGNISGNGSPTATVTAPDGATFMNISYKYIDLAPNEWVITEA